MTEREPWVLRAEPVADLDAYVDGGGGEALRLARSVGAAALVQTVLDSGLRGRGGAGFPTGTKWQTVAAAAAGTAEPSTVVVNAAEGEPGSFKDRAILLADPYRVLEGALVAAVAEGADGVVVATKGSFTEELTRLRRAVAEVQASGWCDGVRLEVVEGPDSYLFGEETGMLEVLDGRPPFPRIAPPYRDGVEAAAPTLVDNVETMANVPGIVIDGPAWFRSTGTDESPGTIVCTVTGAATQHGVGEFAMGTPLRTVLDSLGGEGTADAAVAVLPGASGAVIPARLFDTPLSYEAMAAAGTGLGTGGFIVLGADDDVVAVAHGVARFLAVESCGQCTPCKADGLAIAAALDRLRTSEANDDDLALVEEKVGTVADGARCALARQHEAVVGSVLALFPGVLRNHLAGDADAAEPYLVAPLLGFHEGRAVVDESHGTKQPDWTHDEVDSGKWPAAAEDTHLAAEPPGPPEP